ncbi:magnesium transporter [Flaviflexus massiliensis]|uniref:magnesium transporter n=1 Tax=Flaviflexus massiliensis TaxID=1522309 RepID=UPI0006D5344C|nr:magnesium transporter [Flaviflexus massiliensis]
MRQSLTALQGTIQDLLARQDWTAVQELIEPANVDETVTVFERLPVASQAVFYRLLEKDRAAGVFDLLSPKQQGDLIEALQGEEVASLFAELDPDDRAWILDELPATAATRLLSGLTPDERRLTSIVLGYEPGSIGRRMSPEYVSTRDTYTVEHTLQRVQQHIDEAETIYTIPVVDNGRHVLGIVSLRDLLRHEPDTLIGSIMREARVASAYSSAEDTARLIIDRRLLALPIVDDENRLVGIVTVDDAGRIIEQEESEDSARQGGTDPLGKPYFSTPVRSLVRSRIVWLLVLAIGATLTVQVLSIFESELAQVTALALFVPLLIGTGGNTGNQASTTITRALALGDIENRDIAKVLVRELSVGLLMGGILGILGGIITGAIYGPSIGLTIGLTLAVVCTMAAAVGGIMPIIARLLGVDPAVFSNPFITTFVDATGLVVYFLIAKTVLGI